MKRKKLKKIWIIILLIIFALFIYFGIVTYQIVSKNYAFRTVLPIVTSGIKDKVLENHYSKTLEVAIRDKAYCAEFVDNYFAIDYYDKTDFIKRINTLLGKGYSTADINLMNRKLSDEMIESLYDYGYIQDISSYLEFDYFKSENLYRYIDYYYGNYKEAVVYVNIGLDKEYYSDPNIITEFTEDVLVNKYNKLDVTFEPQNLVQIQSIYTKNGKEEYLSKVAQIAFETMCKDALEDGMHLLASSAYRSYESQQDIYDTYFNLYGQAYVDNYVAIPGYSEYQTGLAVAIAARDYNTFKNSLEYTWMLENGYKYGFILRYPPDKQEITGYKSEAWHFRYVGLEAALYIQENNITYDEYYVMFLDK